MRRSRLFIILILEIVILIAFHGQSRAQSFHKGALMISLSEGTTFSNFTTNNTILPNDGQHVMHTQGDRDPLTIEYGVSDHFGLGLNLGTDIIKVNPETFYGFKVSKNYVNAYMSEITVDGYYHFFNTRHTDWSAFLSLGMSSVTLKGNDGDYAYQYNAGGGIIRVGSKVKYYFRKRFGIMAMVSTYAANCSPKGIKGNTVGNDYTTAISGYAIEFGPCFRFF